MSDKTWLKTKELGNFLIGWRRSSDGKWTVNGKRVRFHVTRPRRDTLTIIVGPYAIWIGRF